MVKSSFVSIFFLLATLSTLAFTSPIQPHDINKFKKDLGVLSRGIYSLAFAINSVGNTITPEQALAIHNQAEKVQREINTCNGDVKGVHGVSNSDARTVVNIEKGFTSVIVKALHTLGEKRKVVERFNPSAITHIRKQLAESHNGAIKLADALIALVPSNIKEEAKKLRNEINAAFNKAIKIYS